jgi:sugar O-acyltransferase (sialic acid O-acetyltransferase NeuD family)
MFTELTKKIVIVGFDPEIFEMICKSTTFIIDGYVDVEKSNDENFNCRYLGNDDMFLHKHRLQKTHLLVITIDSPKKRSDLYTIYKQAGYSFATIISSKSNVSSFSHIDEGCIVQDLVNISYNVKISNNVKLNTGSNIMHDTVIGCNTTIAPDVTVLGYVSIGDSCFIGAGTIVLPRISINNFTTTGAGCVVTKNLDGGVHVGVPARSIQSKNDLGII